MDVANQIYNSRGKRWKAKPRKINDPRTAGMKHHSTGGNLLAVRIRMKRLGRRHRPFYRICAMDSRRPRDGRVLEELGTYDPMIKETDARAVLNGERVDYWLGVGAKPSDNVKVLIKKYGTDGTHLEQQKLAMERVKPKSRQELDRPSVAAEQADSPSNGESNDEPEQSPGEQRTPVEETVE